MMDEDEFLPNLASMLEVSLVEGAHAVLSQDPLAVNGEANSDISVEAISEISGEADSDIVNVNGVASPAAYPCTETEVARVNCTPVVKENEIQIPCTTVSRVAEGNTEVRPLEQDDEAKRRFHSFYKDVKSVMYLRLHCTVCCCHIGCSPAAAFTMAFHKFLRVLICKDCESFYGSGDFACGDDGSETFCRWCGQGGHLYCCSICPNVFCKKCIRLNLGRAAMKQISEKNDWVCYQCNKQPLLAHRAVCWALSTFLKEQSKDEKKIPEYEAEKTPGFNPLLCCQGEKVAPYRASLPLRPIVYPCARPVQMVGNESPLTLKCNEILRDTLTSGGKITNTAPSTVAETSSKTASMTVCSAASLSKPVRVGTSQASSTGKQYMLVRTPAPKNASDATAKLSAAKTTELNGTIRNSALYVLQRKPPPSYESAYLDHLSKTAVQGGIVRQNQTLGRTSSVTVNNRATDTTPANLQASLPVTYNQIPWGTLVLSPTSNSIAAPTVNTVYLSRNNNSGSVMHAVSPLHVSATQQLEQITACGTVSSSDPQNLVPLSTFPSASVPTSGPVQVTCPPLRFPNALVPASRAVQVTCPPLGFPNALVPASSPIQVTCPPLGFPNALVPASSPVQVTCPPLGFPNALVPPSGPVQFNCTPLPQLAVSENATQTKSATPPVSNSGNDDDIVEVFSNVQDSVASEVECKWMMESFKRVNCTSRMFLYHLDIFRQKFEKEGSAKGTSHIVGKYYRLLKKLLKRLNEQKECIPKEYIHWLNAEKAKHGIPTTEEGQSTSPSKDKVSDAEVAPEPELLLDMEITCASDHEDFSDPITEVQQNLIGCNENLSESDSDSDDPFSDCESPEQEKVCMVMKPVLSRTIREVLSDRCMRKFVLTLLTSFDSKTANTKRKIISSTELVQSSDQTEASSVKGTEHDINKLKTRVSMGVQTGVNEASSVKGTEHDIGKLKTCISMGVQAEVNEASSVKGTEHDIGKLKTCISMGVQAEVNEASSVKGTEHDIGKLKTCISMGVQAEVNEASSVEMEHDICKQKTCISTGVQTEVNEALSVKEMEHDICKLNIPVSKGVQTKVNEASSVKKKEANILEPKTHVSTGIETEAISGNCSEFSVLVPEGVPCSGIEKQRSVGTDTNDKAIHGLQLGASPSGTEDSARNKSERMKSARKSNVAKCINTNSAVAQCSRTETSSSGTKGKIVNAECDKINQKYQSAKRKYGGVLCDVTPSRMEAKRLCTRRSPAVVPRSLQRTATPGTDFKKLVHSAMQKKLIKPCVVSVARTNRTN